MSSALVVSLSKTVALAQGGKVEFAPKELSTAEVEAMQLLQSSLSSAAAAGAQQLDTLRRVGPTTATAGKAFVKTAGVVLVAHSETFAGALREIEQAGEALEDAHTKLIGAAMGLERDAAAQQLRLLQDLAGSSPAFDSDEFVSLLEASALRMNRLAAAHVEGALARVRRAAAV